MKSRCPPSDVTAGADESPADRTAADGAGIGPGWGATLLGTTGAVQVGVLVLTITRGSGPSLKTYFTGYWTASGA